MHLKIYKVCKSPISEFKALKFVNEALLFILIPSLIETIEFKPSKFVNNGLSLIEIPFKKVNEDSERMLFNFIFFSNVISKTEVNEFKPSKSYSKLLLEINILITETKLFKPFKLISLLLSSIYKPPLMEANEFNPANEIVNQFSNHIKISSNVL